MPIKNKLYDKKIDCAPCKLKNNKQNKSCYSIESLIKIAKELNKTKKYTIIKTEKRTYKQIWKDIQTRLSKVCGNDDYCWKKQEFVKKLKDMEINFYTFKPDYPKEWVDNPKTWLNTYDIYYVMRQYQKTYKDFVFLGPIPSDCPMKIQCELSKLDLMGMKKEGITKIGIIYNLDTSTQNGSHWVAVYIDNINNEINYYDSTSRKPIFLINKFIDRIANQYRKHKIEPTIIYNDKDHQKMNTECGMYSMNFILERLSGSTMYDISQMELPDGDLNNLRKVLYNTKSIKYYRGIGE